MYGEDIYGVLLVYYYGCKLLIEYLFDISIFLLKYNYWKVLEIVVCELF